MKKSAIVLAGGFSKRIGQEKALIRLADKPLIIHVIERILESVDEIIVVISNNKLKDIFEQMLNRMAIVVVDQCKMHSPLVGALTGFERVKNDLALLLPCDTPFISSRITSFLMDLCVNKNAVVPRWPNGYIEPLQAAYHTKSAFTAAKKSLETGNVDLRTFIGNLPKVQYISTSILQQFDLKLLTFFNINTQKELEKAELTLNRISKTKRSSFSKFE